MSRSYVRHYAIYVAILCGLTFSSRTILGQVTTATILGTVKDDSGAVLPGVSVAVKHVDTGAVRTVVTDDEGRYHAPNLALGNYEVEAELAGFQTAVRSGIKLSLGQEGIVDFTMKVGQISEKVVVSGEAPLVQTTSSTLTALVDDKKIRDLPLNGRDFSQLATLQAGVYAPPSMGQAVSSIFGAGPRISISGARPNQNNFLLDGSDVQDATGRTPAGVSGTTLGVETVREFTVLTSIYSAEYGKVAGGVINAVTKSGTNEFHGTVFEFHRNDNFDARNFFDATKPEFKRNQFGFTAGGPIRKDHTFFFGSYEGLRDRLGLTQRNIVLTPEARQGIFPNRTVPVNPRVKPYLDLFPLPTPGGRNFGDGRAESIRSSGQPTNEDYFLVKIDHTLSSSDSIFVRYNRDNSSINSPQSFAGFDNLGKTRRQFMAIEEKKVISASLLNEFRFSFNRNIYGVATEQTITLDPSLSFVPGRPMGEMSIGGLSGYGYNARQDRFLTQNMFEYIDNVSYNRGNHSMRFGVQVKRIQFNTVSAFAQNARWVFNTVDSFLRGQPFQLDIMIPGSDTVRGWRQTYLGAYIQDDVKITPTFTLNLGLRYELSTEPTEVNGKVANLIHPLTDKEVSVPKTLYENPCLKCLSPRLGFAWDVFGNGKTALRGGFGIFNNVLLPTDWIFSATNLPPFFKRPLLFNPPFPSVLEALASVAIPPFGLDFIDVSPSQPYLLKYNLNIQREIVPDLVVTIGYTGSRTVHAGRQQNLNINQFQVLPDGRKFFPAGAQRFNPVFSAYAYKVFDSQGTYSALQISANKRFSHGLQFQVSYTFSKSMDEVSGHSGSGESTGTTIGSMDPHDRKADYGLSGFDVRNAAVFNFSYDLPMKVTGGFNRLVGGWQINGILTLADGNAVNLVNSIDRARAGNSTVTQGLHDRPNLKSGGNNNPFRDRNPDNYWDGSQFELQEAGFFGNLGRDTGIIPGIVTVDFSVIKNISIDEQRTIQFRSEFFNLLNRANFGLPSRNVFENTSGIPSTTFGRISSTNTTARQVQLALKFLF
ncbi:MAG: TonB-dependent receptor [Acidobacteria bacterium]|nr:TonB-dependent receptor [Acidobacteriota bacterium]